MSTKKKKRTARKIHDCVECHNKIKPGQVYYYTRHIIKEWHHPQEEIISYELKTCTTCESTQAKRAYKKEMRKARARRRIKNCPDQKFELVWQGGWSDGVPDGGDVRPECHNCNLRCVI